MNEFNEPNLVNMGGGNFVPEIKVGAATYLMAPRTDRAITAA